MSLPEIARLLETKLSTIEGRVYRALRKLRVELEGDPAPGLHASGDAVRADRG